eukprot:GHRQ01040128.1.p1 GENE.GHRQ01040128.1~~GHRQ01040128.1.p1  ORF type:complete len:130 (-),score=31.16 GHRQ01040128.1:39-428(-)
MLKPRLYLCLCCCMQLLLPSPHPIHTCCPHSLPLLLYIFIIFIQPAVAFANIGELAVDVLVCTLKAQLAARLDDENLLACAGNNAYSLQPPGLLATALELYQVPGGRLGACVPPDRAASPENSEQALLG